MPPRDAPPAPRTLEVSAPPAAPTVPTAAPANPTLGQASRADSVFALELDEVLDMVRMPVSGNMSDSDKRKAARDAQLKQMGVPREPRPTFWTKLRAHAAPLAAVACCALAAYRLHATFGFVGLYILARNVLWAEEKEFKLNVELAYMMKVHMFLRYADTTDQAVLVVTRNTKLNVLSFFESAAVHNPARIPILSDPAHQFTKAQMVQKWLDEDCQAWCAKHSPASLLRQTPARTAVDPTVYIYGTEATEECATRFWNLERRAAQAEMHYVRVAHCPLSFTRRISLGLASPGLFQQRRPLQHLWDHMHGRTPTRLPPFMELLLTD